MTDPNARPRMPGAPFVPIVVGVLLTIPGVSLLAAGTFGDGAPGRVGGLALALATFGPVLFVVGVCMIPPWVRLLRETTADQRRAMRTHASGTAHDGRRRVAEAQATSSMPNRASSASR